MESHDDDQGTTARHDIGAATANGAVGAALGRRRFARSMGVGGLALLAGGIASADRADAATTGSWSLTGNTATTPPSNFMGTTDNQALAFRTNNLERARILATGQMGVGLAAPTAQLHAKAATRSAVEGDTASPTQAGVIGKNTAVSPSARGVVGSVVDTGYAVRGDAGNGFGVYGNATGATGAGVGGYGANIGVVASGTNIGIDATSGPSGIAMRATANGASSIGVAAATDVGIGIFGSCSSFGSGVEGTCASGGVGVRGLAVNGVGVYGGATTGNGVFGIVNDPAGTAVRGDVETTLGGTGVGGTVLDLGFGVYGRAGRGYGVYGEAESTSGVGVAALGAAGGGVAVQAIVPSTGYGVQGITHGAGIGIYGSCTDKVNGNAGRFDGDVVINGSLFASVKHFRIDHPVDPANKYLVHTCIEGPEALTIYSGSVTLDAAGQARVALPSYFDALNANALIQLTGIGRDHVFVEQGVRDGHFLIGGGPGQEVHWQVTARRTDAAAHRHAALVEVDKPAHERGYFLDPGAHGRTDDRSMTNAPPFG